MSPRDAMLWRKQQKQNSGASETCSNASGVAKAKAQTGKRTDAAAGAETAVGVEWAVADTLQRQALLPLYCNLAQRCVSHV